MNVFAYYQTEILSAISHLKNEGILGDAIATKNVTVEPPRDRSHGDVATNAAMVLAKQAKMKPRDLAEKIAPLLEQNSYVQRVDIAGPGFINLTLKNEIWYKVAQEIFTSGPNYGRSDVGNEEKVNVEYVSTNPTGPIHIGHCRGAVYGDALANLLEFANFDVSREYYINDAGAQVDVLARSVYLRYLEVLGEDVGEIPEGLYPGAYLIPIGQELARKFGDELKEQKEEEWLPTVRTEAVAANMTLIKDDLAALNISHDIFFSEQSLTADTTDLVAQTINDLRAQDLIYEGRLPPPKGNLPDDWEDREQTLFKATDFGDDVDRALVKSDGSYTYFAADMAYHRSKYERGFNTMINVWGSDHSGYVKRMKSAVKALTANQAHLDVKICQIVNLFRSGALIKMSKRAGTYVTVREVVDEVGADSVRFIMLFRKNDAVLDFDFDKVLEQSKDNPVFYVQYAHARIHSVFRNASELFNKTYPEVISTEKIHWQHLDHEEEINLIKRLSEFPRLVEAAALNHEPHRIAFYIYDVASDFHGLWNKGKELPQLRFINETNRDLTQARLALITNVATVIASGLEILGVKPKVVMT